MVQPGAAPTAGPQQQERRSTSSTSHFATAAGSDDASVPQQRVLPRPDPSTCLLCKGLLSVTPRVAPQGQSPQLTKELRKSTVLLTCGHLAHRACWSLYRWQEYDDFKSAAELLTTDQIWKEYKTGQYFKMLQCPTCEVPAHELRYDRNHSGINEHIGWAVHDNHVYPPTHFHLGDLGSSTGKMSELAKAILLDQSARGALVRRPHEEAAEVQNVDDSIRLEQAIVAEEYEHSRRAVASRSSSSTGGQTDTGLGFTFTTDPQEEPGQNFAVLKVADDEPYNSVRPYTTSYHATTRPMDGRMALLIDPGSVGNLCGDRWAKELAQLGKKHGQDPKIQTRTANEGVWSWVWIPEVREQLHSPSGTPV